MTSFFLLMGFHLGPFEGLLKAYGILFGDLMESFLESSWYSSYFEIENVMILERQRCQKDIKLTDRQRCTGMTHRYNRKDVELLKSSWRAFWIAHDIVLIGSL